MNLLMARRSWNMCQRGISTKDTEGVYLLLQVDVLVKMYNHPILRYFLGYMMPPRVTFLKLTTVGKIELRLSIPLHSAIHMRSVPLNKNQ